MDALRNSIWNVIQMFVFQPLDGHNWVTHEPGFRIVREIWIHFFKRPVDELQGYWPTEKQILRKWFFDAQWNEVYDFLEFVADAFSIQQKKLFIDSANAFLARSCRAAHLSVT